MIFLVRLIFSKMFHDFFFNMLQLNLYKIAVFLYSTMFKVCSIIFFTWKNKNCEYGNRLSTLRSF